MKKFISCIITVLGISTCQASYHFGDPIYSRKSEEELKLQQNLSSIFLAENDILKNYEDGLREENVDHFKSVISQTSEFMSMVKKLPNSTQALIHRDVIRVGTAYVQALSKIDEMTKDKN